MQTLADRIGQARRSRGWSQSGLAEHLGVTASAVGHWERPGGSRPSSERLCAIAGHLSVNVDWLVYGRGDMQPGATGQPAPDIISPSNEEQQLLRHYRNLPYHAKALILQFVQQLHDSSQQPHASARRRQDSCTIS